MSLSRGRADACCAALLGAGDAESLVARENFLRASSTLRFACNAWVPRLERLDLVAEALALLA